MDDYAEGGGMNDFLSAWLSKALGEGKSKIKENLTFLGGGGKHLYLLESQIWLSEDCLESIKHPVLTCYFFHHGLCEEDVGEPGEHSWFPIASRLLRSKKGGDLVIF